MYTFDFGGEEEEGMHDKNPYRLLDSALDSKKKGKKEESKKDERIKGVRDVLCLVMTALRKLPVVEGVCDAVPRGQEGGGSEAVQGGAGTIVWAAFSSPSPDMKGTKAFLNKKEERPRGENEKGRRWEIWRDVDRENSEKDQKKGKNTARGNTLHHRRCVGLRHRALFDLPRARRRRSCWRDLSGSLRMRASLVEMSSLL